MIRIDGFPTPRCRCPQCRTMRLRIWQALSEPKRRAVEALDERNPRTAADLLHRSAVRRSTLDGLWWRRRDGQPLLANRLELSAALRDAARIEFFTLSPLGAEVLAEAKTHQRKRA